MAWIKNVDVGDLVMITGHRWLRKGDVCLVVAVEDEDYDGCYVVQVKRKTDGLDSWVECYQYKVIDNPGQSQDGDETEKQPELEAPPTGLRPRFVVEHERCIEILEAMLRYKKAGKTIPVEWMDELADVI